MIRLSGRKSARGFTLVEIMIVVAIIALIAAIAIPNLLRARHNANEGAAIGSMHTLVASLESFRAASVPPAYPADWAALATADPPYIDPVLQLADDSTTPKQGYFFTYTRVDPDTYTLIGAPSTEGVTGTRQFFADESGVIRASASGVPTVANDPIG